MKNIADVSDRSIADLVSLEGRTAVVTGGGQGLGFAIAARLAEAGANVLIGDIDADLARNAAERIAAVSSGKILGTFMDVSDSASVEKAAAQASAEAGLPNIWVNNAGIFPSVPLPDMTDETWNAVLAVNAGGTFVGARTAERHMREAGNGGVIVNVASTAAFKGVATGLSAYVASKHAVRGLTKQMALELAPQGIRVLGVAPTFCVTEGNLKAAAEQSGADVSGSDIAAMLSSRLGRVGVPDDVARVVLFCVSDMAMFMTGSTLLVDAGETI